ncbi:MAG: hypothetical protein KME12_17120 [Trichocoleus desertorum ATA4-8-CV12]|jgi:hypothetical protein|nr:hypothetical protein [Trichocoleus desertorum ATA4-8-CV12]
MTPNPYLQHLIADPTFGYLFPHRLTLAAFGVPNDYHLRKHYPRLVEGQHYLKIRGTDHVERLFYTLVGLLMLADLVNTPQSQAFKQALVTHTQPPGAIVPAPSPSLTPYPSGGAAYSTPDSTFHEPYPESYPTPAPTSVAPYHLPAIVWVSGREQPSDRPLPRFATNIPTPQDTAALIFEAQRVAGEQAQQTAQALLQAQRLVAEQQPTEIHVNVNLWKRWDDWLSRQDTWAVLLIVTSLVAMAGIGTYLLVSAAVRPTPAPLIVSPQSQGR